jgi:hypothetical protein
MATLYSCRGPLREPGRDELPAAHRGAVTPGGGGGGSPGGGGGMPGGKVDGEGAGAGRSIIGPVRCSVNRADTGTLCPAAYMHCTYALS